MKSKLVLITGITGKTGAYFIQALKANGLKDYKYRALIRETSNRTALIKSGLPIGEVYGDLNNINSISSALEDVHTVLHIAGIHTSLNLVKAVLNSEVKRLILVHTTGIYSKYKSAGAEYIRTEETINKLLEGRDIAVTILRPTMIYGSLDDGNISIFIKMIDKLRIFPVVNRAAFPLQPVLQRDLGLAYYQVLINEESTKNRNYILSGLYPIDLIDILKTMSRYMKKKTIFLSVPYPAAYLGACLLYYLSFHKMDYREKVQRLVEPRAYGHEEAVKDFGYSPTDFRLGVRKEIREYKNRQNLKSKERDIMNFKN